MPESGAERPQQEIHPLRLLATNVALLATLAAFLTVVIRALIVARLDPVTATGIVRTSGPVNVFVGTLTGDFERIVLIAFVAFVYWRLRMPGASPPGVVASLTVMTVVGVLVGFVGSWIGLVWVFLVGMVLVYHAEVSRLARREDASLIYLVGGMTGVALTSLGTFLFSGQVWLPPETVHLRDAPAVLGYVLEDEGPWISILRESDRSLVFVPEDDVESREPCTAGETDVDPSMRDVLVDLFSDVPSRPRYPPCS